MHQTKNIIVIIILLVTGLMGTYFLYPHFRIKYYIKKLVNDPVELKSLTWANSMTMDKLIKIGPPSVPYLIRAYDENLVEPDYNTYSGEEDYDKKMGREFAFKVSLMLTIERIDKKSAFTLCLKALQDYNPEVADFALLIITRLIKQCQGIIISINASYPLNIFRVKKRSVSFAEWLHQEKNNIIWDEKEQIFEISSKESRENLISILRREGISLWGW